MLVAAAVVPGAPMLIPELMGEAATEVQDVRAAAREAFCAVAGTLLGPGGRAPIGRLVVVGAPASRGDAASRSYEIAHELVDGSFGPTLRLPALPGARSADPLLQAGPDGSGEPVPTSLLVARHLAGAVSQELRAAEALWPEALWVTVAPEAAVAYGRTLARDDAPIGLVLVADGAACHGPKAPRGEDARAADYDEAVCRALDSGDPRAMASLDRALGRELSAEGAGLWPLLAAATAGTSGPRWRADLRWRGAPYGVGWFVATWQRRAASAT